MQYYVQSGILIRMESELSVRSRDIHVRMQRSEPLDITGLSTTQLNYVNFDHMDSFILFKLTCVLIEEAVEEKSEGIKTCAINDLLG